MDDSEPMAITPRPRTVTLQADFQSKMECFNSIAATSWLSYPAEHGARTAASSGAASMRDIDAANTRVSVA